MEIAEEADCAPVGVDRHKDLHFSRLGAALRLNLFAILAERLEVAAVKKHAVVFTRKHGVWLGTGGDLDLAPQPPPMTARAPQRRRARGGARRLFAALAVRNFRLYFSGQAVSLIGTWMQSVALVWLVLELTGSAALLGLVVAVQFLPVLLLGAYAAGGARYAHEITTQYAKDRKQFDKPLGAFQAIAHYLADASTTVDGARVLVYEAAWAASQGRPVKRLAAMAKLFACDTFRDVTAMAQQVHGGIGFTLEYDIQLFFRRAKQWQMNHWDSTYLAEQIAADMLDDPASVTVADPLSA